MTTTMLSRLLRYPHAAVFDKSPGTELALRIRHPLGSTWLVSDDVLTVTAGAGAPTAYVLADYNVSTLAQALVAAGFEVPVVSANWAGRSALTLIDGQGDQAASNGDHIGAFTSLLWAVYSGYAGELRDAKYQIGQALRQMIIPQSEGEWLDVWGTLYGNGRQPGELDSNFAPRIPQEAFRIRVNAHGIEQAILDTTGFDVRIEEPWRNIFRLDESMLSDAHRMYDGARIGYHLLQPTTTSPGVDWADVLPVIERNRAAGVLVLGPFTYRIAHIDANAGVLVAGGGFSERMSSARYQDRKTLDYDVVLDDTLSIINHMARARREVLHSSGSVIGPQPWTDIPWGLPTWGDVYLVHGAHVRTYRVYFTDLSYSSQYWTDRRTWTTSADTWSGLDPMFETSHTQS